MAKEQCDRIETVLPADIETRSMAIIASELGDTSHLSDEEKHIVMRVIHTTADFDYLHNLRFSPDGVTAGLHALREGAIIVTDTQMALAGINKPALRALGCEGYCFMDDPEAARMAHENGTTRAVASMDIAARRFADRPLIFAIGNAPTALLRLRELTDSGTLSPALIIGTPVGFVNVVPAKERIMASSVPFIVAAGRKGGSTVATAICNALLYMLYDRSTGKCF